MTFLRLPVLPVVGVVLLGVACGGGGAGTGPAPGPATQIAINGGDGQTGAVNSALPVSYSVIARDANNRPVSGVAVTWAVASGGGSVGPTPSTTIASGVASATRTLGPTAVTQTATATAPGLTGSPLTFTATATTAPMAASVTVGNNFFNPNAVTIAVGGTVTWTWSAGAVTHNVTFAPTAGAPANIGNTSSGSAARQFNSAGTFNYECTIHGAPMNGTVTVQ